MFWRYFVTTFVDRVILKVSGGRGGNGCASVHREKFKPLGGPDGGNGGRGGDVIVVADSDVTTLLEFHHSPHRKATNGAAGQGGHKNGAQGPDIILKVPIGTLILDEGGLELADLIRAGDTYTLAAGGRGGLGNAALASSKRRAPGFALLGEEGEAKTVIFELKTLADVGLVGFPSAGKSSLISVISEAKPKVADYPFTTLIPNLGVVKVDDIVFTVADVPGLIPGASEGKGLGLEFLRHIERCSVLVHVVDCATLESGRDPVTDIQTIELELERYGGLEEKPRIVALNKVDIPEALELAELTKSELEAGGYKVFPISTVSRVGLSALLYELADLVKLTRKEGASLVAPRIILRPKPIDDDTFTVKKFDEYWQVLGKQPERWVAQTDFTNDEAVGYLADRLARLGVEITLLKLGAEPGDTVVIGKEEGGVIFDFQPEISAGETHAFGRRGQDVRLEPGGRKTRLEAEDEEAEEDL